MFITVFESEDYCGMLKMYCLISKTCDATRNIKNEGFIQWEQNVSIWF